MTTKVNLLDKAATIYSNCAFGFQNLLTEYLTEHGPVELITLNRTEESTIVAENLHELDDTDIPEVSIGDDWFYAVGAELVGTNPHILCLNPRTEEIDLIPFDNLFVDDQYKILCSF